MAHPSRLNSVIARAVDGSKFKLEWYHKNYLDHVYAVSDDSGDLLEHYRYTAFGEVSIYNSNGNQVATTQIDNHILWNTRRRDELTGYYMYKYRHYAPELGRWPSRDPIEERGGVNLYAFVGNEPVGKWDYLGLASVEIKTTCGKKFDKCNPTRAEILEFLKSLPKKCLIKKFEVNGHGSTDMIEYNLDEVIVSVGRPDGTMGVVWGPGGDDFASDIEEYLDDKSFVTLDGCKTACEFSLLGGKDENLAKILSENVSGTVTGFAGFGAGDSFFWWPRSNVTMSLGKDRGYKDGKEVELNVSEPFIPALQSAALPIN